MVARRIRRILLLVGGLTGLGVLTGCFPGAQTFVVNSTADEVDAAPGDGVCATAGGACTLRAAVMEANADPDREVVVLAPQTYVLTLAGAAEDRSETGDLDVLSSLRIVGNDAVVDGASLDRVFDLHDGGVEMTDVTVTGGDVAGEGGGIRRRGDALQIVDSAVVGNRALVGGGVFNDGQTGLVNVSLLDNTATGGPGGAFANGPAGQAVLWTSTVAGNRAATAGGGLSSSSNDGGNSLRVIGTVVSDNGTAPDGTPIDCAVPAGAVSTITSLGNNLDAGTSCGFTVTGDRHGDPMLGPTIDPVDAPPFRRPLPGSPLVDALPVGADECLPHADQRGVARPQGVRCDIGAVEVLPTELEPLALTVDTPIDTTDDVPGDGRCVDAAGSCSLRAAVQETNAYPTPDVVTVVTGIDPRLSRAGVGEDASATGDLDIRGRIEIVGAGATIDAHDLDRVFDVRGDGELTLTNATVTGGNARATCGVRSEGGGVRVVDGFARIEQVTLSDNVASGSNEGFGGGLANVGGTVAVARSAIVDNEVTAAPCSASGGATRAEGGGIANEGALAVEQSTIAQNHADAELSSGGVGGGLVNHDGEVDLVASTVVDNDADLVGSGLISYTNRANPQGALELHGTLIAGNDCGDAGDLSGQAASTLVSSGFNVGGPSCGLTSGGDIPSSISLPGPAANGGPTPSILPAPGTAPIDAIPAGTAGLCDGTLATDQRGAARPFDGNGDGDEACDIGSVESTVVPTARSFVVDTAADLPDGNPGDGLCQSVGTGRCTLRAAVQETNQWPTADTITIGTGVSPTLTRSGANEDSAAVGDLDIRDELVLAGNGSVVNANRLDRVFHVLSIVTIRDLTIRGGGANTNGAGVRNQGGQLHLEHVTVVDNQGAVGGGIRNDNGGVLDVVDSTISGNSSTGNGAAIYAASGETDIILSTVTANSSGSGGAVRGDGVFRVAGTAIGDQLLGVDCSGSITTLGYNVVTAVTGCPASTTGDAAVTSLRLDPLADNGGPTPTHLPRPDSPLRDRIAPDVAMLCDGTHPTDQRGVPRAIDSDSDGIAACDTGSVEAPVAPRFVGVPAVVPSNGALVALQAVPAGGTFSGPGVNGTTLNPAAGGTGNRTISYTDAGQTVTTVVEVFRVSLTYTVTPVSQTRDRYTFTGTPSGGSYDAFVVPGPGISGNTLVTDTCGHDIDVEYSGTYKGVAYSIELTIDRPVCPKPVS
jgi:CSLREA domain-containing protein